MTGKEKVLAALSPAGTRQLPAVICYEGIFIRDHWKQWACPWWYAHSPDLGQQLEFQAEVVRRTGQDWIELRPWSSRAERVSFHIEQWLDGVYAIDASGQARRMTPPVVSGTVIGAEPPGHLADTVDEIDRLRPPPSPFDAAAFRAEGRADLADAALAGPAAGLLPIASIGTPLWACFGLWGFEGMMTMLVDQPDLVHHATRRHLAGALEQVKMAATLGARAIWLEECMTDMISPAAFEEFNLPCLRQLIESIRAAGLASIYYYCGNPDGKWDLILSAGADALSLEESKKTFRIDIEDVVAHAAGRCAVLGNLDSIGVLEQGSERQLRDEVRRQLDAGRANGGRFIMSLGSPVTPDTPIERVKLYSDLVHETHA